MSFNIEVESGKTVKLPTGGKYCSDDIVVSAVGGGGGSSETNVFDQFQEGTYGNYYYAFALNRFSDETYTPTSDIICSSTKGTSASQNIFYQNKLITDTKVPIRVNGGGANQMFAGCSALENIVLLDFNNVTSLSGTFSGCSNLVEVRFSELDDEHTGIEVSFNISQCPKLSSESMTSIFNGLATMTAETAKTITVHSSVEERLTEEQLSILEQKNWNVATA